MKIVVLNINQSLVERGVEIFWKNLSMQLINRGAEVKIISSQSPVIQNKSSSIFFKLLRRLYLDLYSLKVLFFTLLNLKKIVDFKMDIIIPTNGGWQVLVIRLIRQIGLIGKSKIVIIGHSGIGHDEKFNLKFGGADLFIVLTHEQESWAKKINPKIKIQYIPNGVDTNLFKNKGETYDFKLEKPIFLTVASFEKYKNIDKTIEVISQLNKGGLVILGNGREEKRLRILCDEKLKGRYFLGKINHDDLPKYYRGASVFTLVSGYQEAFGLVYLEAMACGLPVVAADDSKRRDIVGDAGLIVDPEDIEEYKTALMKAVFFNWEEKPRFQAEKFEWKIIAEKYYQLFHDICVEMHHDASL